MWRKGRDIAIFSVLSLSVAVTNETTDPTFLIGNSFWMVLEDWQRQQERGMETSKEIQVMRSCVLHMLESLWVHDICVHKDVFYLLVYFSGFKQIISDKPGF